LRIFLVVEFSALSLIFYYNLKQKILRKLILLVVMCFVTFSVYDYIVSDAINFSYIPLAAECLIILIYIIYFFYEKIQVNTFIPIYQTNIFWIAVAFTLYCAGNFFLFLYTRNAYKDDQFRFQYALIYCTFTILKNIFLCIGITIKQPKENNQYDDFLTQHDFPDLTIHKKNT